MSDPVISAPAFDLSGKLVVLTGAAGVLGRVFAGAIAGAGADLVLVDREQGALDALADALLAALPAGRLRPAAVACDLADRGHDARPFETALAVFGRPACRLVNNAASKSASLDDFFSADEDYPLRAWREVMTVNLEAPFYLSGQFARRLKEAGRAEGAIVNIASIYGHMAPDQRIYEGSHYLGRQIRSPAVYSASKAGVLGLTRHCASLWAQQGVRVNSLAPGGVSSGQNGVFHQNYARRVPLGRMARETDMTGAMVFLLSDASAYVTGQNWLIDGGLSAW